MASMELEVQKRELVSLVDELRFSLKKIKDFQSDRSQKLLECQQIEQQIRTVKEAYVLELRGYDAEERRPEEVFLKDRMLEFKRLLQEMDYKKNELDREHLVEEDLPDESQNNLQVEQVVKAGDAILDKSDQAVARMKGMVLDAEEVGLATAQKMDEQTEQMTKIRGGLDDMQYNLQRSKKTVNMIAKDAANDRCIQIMCGSVFVCLIVMIALWSFGHS